MLVTSLGLLSLSLKVLVLVSSVLNFRNQGILLEDASLHILVELLCEVVALILPQHVLGLVFNEELLVEDGVGEQSVLVVLQLSHVAPPPEAVGHLLLVEVLHVVAPVASQLPLMVLVAALDG